MLKADVNAVPASSSVERVYAQVLADIDEAAAHLQVEQWEEGLNYRFNRLSAEALRARVLLYMGNWTEALEAAAKVVKAHPALEDMTTSATLPNDYRSVESIVALEKLSANLYTVVDMPSPEFIGLYRSGDQRRTKYFKRVTSSAYSLQKGADDAYACSFRSAEAYLTAAECAARLGQKDEAVSLYLEPLMKARLSASAYETTAALLAEMSAEEKNRISHRGMALRKMGKWISINLT